MALKKKGKYFYGDSQADIAPELARYSEANGYPIDRMTDLKCECGSERLGLLVDGEEGAAVQVCAACQRQTPIGDSADYLEDAELEECECVCGGSQFEISTGAAFYEDSTDVRRIRGKGAMPRAAGGAERQRKAADGSPGAESHAGALRVEPPWGTRLPGPPSLEGATGGVGLMAGKCSPSPVVEELDDERGA